MRGSLIWLLAGAASVGACVVGSFGGVPAAAQDAPQPRASAVSDETVKDVEVMRRVLVREGLGTRGNAATTDVHLGLDLYAANVWNGISASASEAFVVPGQGATFVLRTSDSVAPQKGDDDAAAGPEKPSAWDEEAAALDGKPAAARAHRRASRYEASKVDALRTRLLDVLAKYGQKIRGLGATDRLTVIVVGGIGGNTFLEPQIVTSNEQGAAALRTVLTASNRSSDGRTVLVMSAAVADCQASASGTLGADEFKRRASVSAY